jgi:dihydroflavonol-4-reductase
MRESVCMRALVTGSTGFIGTHLVAALAARGWQVRCLVRHTSRREPLAAYEVEYIVGRLEDRESLHRAVRDVAVVFHLAGVTRVHLPADYDRINAEGTRNLIDACVAAAPGLRKFLLVSSIAAAGPSRTGQALTEADDPRPVGPYGRSKLRAERIVLSHRDQLPVAVLRPSAIYGPRDSDFLQLFRTVKYGWLPHAGGRDLHVDLCYIDDLVRGMLAAADHAASVGEVFFLGGNRHTWRQLGRAIGQQMGVRVREIVLPRPLVLGAASLVEAWARLRGRVSIVNRASMLERLQPYWIYDSTKAHRTFGYTPRVSLEEGIAVTLAWYRNAGWL